MRLPTNQTTSAPDVLELTEDCAGSSHQRMVRLTDLTCKALQMLRDAATDGRATWVTGHHAENADGSCTVAFRNKAGGKTATFKVENVNEAKACCKIMRYETRR